jgi:hypothetical protein
VYEELLQNCCTSVWQKMFTQVVLQKDEMYKEAAENIVLLAD